MTVKSISNVLDSAKNVTTYIQNNEKTPATVGVNGLTVSRAAFNRMMAATMVEIYNGTLQNILTDTVQDPAKPAGGLPAGQMQKAEYIKVAQAVKDFIAKKGRMPNYITTSIGKMSPFNFMDMFSRALVYYVEHKTLPNYINTVNKTSTNTNDGWVLTGTYTPDYQDTDHTCGPSSEQMVFSALGETVKEAYIAQLAGTTSSGTDHQGLMNAAKKIDSNIKTTEYYFSDLGPEGLATKLKGNAECILHIRTGTLKTDAEGKSCWQNDYGHYIFLVGVNVTKQLIRVFDPTKGLRNFTVAQIKTATAAVTKQKSCIMFYK